VPFVACDPGPGRDVGNRIVAGEILGGAESLVQHAVDTFRFVTVALLGVFGFAAVELQEVMGLAEHRADATHLHHQPLDATPALLAAAAQTSRLVGEVQQNRARLHQHQP
jgi:hypothetical protein